MINTINRKPWGGFAPLVKARLNKDFHCLSVPDDIDELRAKEIREGVAPIKDIQLSESKCAKRK